MSKRDNRKQSHQDEEKKLKAMKNELRDIWNAQRALGWVELPKPVQHGWKKVLKIRSDLKRGKSTKHLTQLLELIQSSVRCNDRSFIEKDWKTKRRKEIFAEPRTLSAEEFELLSDKLKMEFKKGIVPAQSYRWGTFQKTVYEYVVDKDWRFVNKIEKHFVTKVRLKDPDLDRREAEIENYLYSNNLWEKIWKIYGQSSHHKDDWNIQGFQQLEKRLKNEVKDEIMNYTLALLTLED